MDTELKQTIKVLKKFLKDSIGKSKKWILDEQEAEALKIVIDLLNDCI